jgi:protoheme ferro-lyase
MTESMKNWAENYINDARIKKTQTTIYYGIVTKAISNEVKKFDADTGQAEILIKTQRRESAGITSNSTTFYQDIIIKYAREQNVWRVDGIYWQNR